MADELFTDAKPDGFTKESPIRAFTDFNAQGTWAIGKGFRPSLQHLPTYLDAMQAKEGWTLVQMIVSPTGGDPTMIFQRDRILAMTVPTRPAVVTGEDEMLSFVAGRLNVEPETLMLEYQRTNKGKNPIHRLHDCPILHAKLPQALQEALNTFNSRHPIRKPSPAPFGTIAPEKAMVNAGAPPGTYERMHIDVDAVHVGDVPDLGAPHDVSLLIRVTSNFGREHEASGMYKQGAWHFIIHMGNEAFEPMTEVMRGQPLAWRERSGDTWMPPLPASNAVNGAGQEQEWSFVHHADKEDVLGDGSDYGITPIEDDPINPKHYGGTHCAEIGELLTANSYQVLKYNWRLGEKDSAEIELGKALWYLERELVLHGDTDKPVCHALPEHPWFDERLKHATDHAKAVARVLISWNRYGNRHSLTGLRKSLVRMRDGLTERELPEGLAV